MKNIEKAEIQLNFQEKLFINFSELEQKPITVLYINVTKTT